MKNVVKTKVSADVRQPGYGPVHRHRETQQLQAHLPEPLGPLQVLMSFDVGDDCEGYVDCNHDNDADDEDEDGEDDEDDEDGVWLAVCQVRHR